MASERKSFSVKWRIEKFRSWLQKQEDVIRSPEFSIETMEGTKWRLCLSSNCEPTRKYFALTLLREMADDGHEVVDLDYELSFLANDDSPLKSEKFTTIFGSATSSHELLVKKDIVLFERKHEYLPQENLTVSCRVSRNWSSVAKYGKCFIRSVIGFQCITLEGIIENFSSLGRYQYRKVNLITPSTGISLVSLHFYYEENWLKFERLQYNNGFLFTGKLFVLDTLGNKTECEKHCGMNADYVPISSFNHIYQLYYTIENLIANNFLPNDILTLQFEVAINPGIELENVEYVEFPQNCSDLVDLDACHSEENSSSNIQRFDLADKVHDAEDQSGLLTSFKNDMTSLHNDHLFCDTLIQTGTETFPAHKSVLSARSPVFKKMFTTDMKEMAGKAINISDLSPDAVRRMLFFIYTDTIDDLDWKNVKELYFASDKYEIFTLKRRCSIFIKRNLTPSNVCEILILADRHQDDYLKFAVQDYILKHDQEVFSSDEWKLFMESYSHLAAQIMYIKCLKK